MNLADDWLRVPQVKIPSANKVNSILTRKNVNLVGETRRNDQPQRGRTVDDDLPVAISQRQTAARCPTPPQIQPQQVNRDMAHVVAVDFSVEMMTALKNKGRPVPLDLLLNCNL